MKKSIFLNTLRLLLLTAAAALFAPDNALGQDAVFKASFYDENWNSYEKDFTSLEAALKCNYKEELEKQGKVMDSYEVKIKQLAAYEINENLTLSALNYIFSIEFEKELRGSLSITLEGGNLSINCSDAVIQANFTVGQSGNLSISGGQYTNSTNEILKVNGGILSINGGTFSGENNVASISSGELNITLDTELSGKTNALDVSGGTVNIFPTPEDARTPVFSGESHAINATGGTFNISTGEFVSTTEGNAAIVNSTGNKILQAGYGFYDETDKMIFHKDGDNYLLEKYNADYGMLSSNGTDVANSVYVDRGAVFAASDGADTKYFTTLENALTYDAYNSDEITVSLIQDYECYEKYFGKHGSYDGIEYLSLTKSFILDFTKFSIQDSLTATISGSKTLTIKGNSNTNLYASFHLEGSSTLNLNGGNYDFYTEIVKISSGCTANISDNVNFVASQEYSYASMAQYAAKRYDMFIENQGTLNITNGSFSYGSKTKNNDNDAKGIYNNGGTVTIEDGTIKTDYGPAILNENSGTVKISGGKFSGNNYGISASLDTETELSGGEFSGSTSAVFNGNGNGIGNSVLKTGYAFYNGEKQIEEHYEEDKTLANSTTSEAYKKVSVNLAGTIILGKGAKYKVAGTFSDYNADADKAQGVWAEQSGGQWYIMTSSAVSEGSYTVTESETNTIKIKIKDYFKDVLEQKWYRAITVYTRSKSISEATGFYKDDNNRYYGQTISTDIETDHKIYVNGETTDENSSWLNIDGDGKTEVTLELRDDYGNVYALKKRTINFDKYKPSITIECDGVAVPQVSTHEAYDANEVIILPDSKLSFKFNDNKAPDGSTLTGDKISAFGGIVYNDGTNDHVFTDSTTAATGIDAKNLAGKTVVYYAFDKAGYGLDYGDSLKVTFALAKFKATYKQDNKDVTKYFTNLKDALTSSNYTDAVTDITIETLENEITDQSTEDIEVQGKNFTFITNGKTFTGSYSCIKVLSGKLTINGGTFIGTSSDPTIHAAGGYVTITGGTFKNTSTSGNAVWSSDGGTIEINGGSFESQNNCLDIGEGGTGIVNEGTFTSTREYSSAASIAEMASSLEINGGTFTGKYNGLSCNMANATLSGGTFIGGEAAISHNMAVLKNGYAFYDQNGKMLIFKDSEGNYVLDDFSLLDASGAAYKKLSVKAVTATVIPDEMTLGKGADLGISIIDGTSTTYTFTALANATLVYNTTDKKYHLKTTNAIEDGNYTFKTADNKVSINFTVKEYSADVFKDIDDKWLNQVPVSLYAPDENKLSYKIGTAAKQTIETIYEGTLTVKVDNVALTNTSTKNISSNGQTEITYTVSNSYGVLSETKHTVQIDLRSPNVPTLRYKTETSADSVDVTGGTQTAPVEIELFKGDKISINAEDNITTGIVASDIDGVSFMQVGITDTTWISNHSQIEFNEAGEYTYFLKSRDNAGNRSSLQYVKVKVQNAEKITADDIAGLLNLTKEYDGGIYVNSKNNEQMYTGGSPVSLAYKGIFLNFSSTGIVYDSKDAGDKKKITATPTQVKYNDNTNNIIYVIDGAKTGEDFTISTEGEITARPINVTEGITAENKVYDGTTAATLNFENARLNGVLSGDDKPEITATGTFENANAGENKTVTISEIKIKLNEGEVSNYKIATADNQSETTATITPKEVESPVITIDVEEIVYNGEAQKPAITVKDGETVIPSDEFEITYENNTDAGTATIKITDKSGGNYVISDKEASFEIAKANPEFSKEPESAGALSFTGQAQPLLTAGETSDGEILYRLGEDGEYSSEIPSASAPGVYTVYCKIVGDKNHNDSEDFTVTVRILQQTVSYTLGKNAEIKLPYPETVVFTSDNSNVSVTDNVLKTTSSVKDGDKAVLTSENYVISVTIVEPLKSIEIEDIWHNGDVHLKAPDMSAFDEGSELHINGHKVEDIENEVISEEGENTVVYEIKDPESNIICHEERIIKIDKSAPDTKAEASSVNKTRYNITVTVDGGMKYFFRNGAEAGFNVTDLFSGVKSMEYSWDNKDNFQNLDPSTLVGLKSGAHTLYIRVSDNAGNTEILSADFTVFDDSKFANGSDTVISLPVYYSSDEIESQTFDINLNGNTVFAIKDSKDGVYYGKTTDGVYFTGNVLTVTSDYLKTLKPDGENMLYVYINPLGGEGWNEDFTPKDYECQIMKIKLDIIYEVRVNGDYKFTAPNDNSITTFCDGEDVMLTFTLDTKYSKADFVSIETMEVYNEDLKEQITFRIPKGALKGGNEPLKLTFRKESYTADDTVTFPGDYPSEYNIKVYDDVIAIDNSGQHFLNDQYTWFIDMKEIPGETKQFLDLLKYMTDGQKHSFSVKVVDVTGGSFRVCPDESFTIESIGKRKAVSVNVYPNPAESGKMFYIELENFGEENFPNTEILIYNQLGTVVEKISAVEKLNPVSLNAGFYSGTVLVSGKKMLNFKIIVK